MTKFLKYLLVFLLLIQVLISAGFELAHDEAYYWLFSKNLDWGYFDHPPMAALLVRIFSFWPHSELGVRFGFVILQFLSLVVLLKSLDKKHWTTASIMFFAFPLASFAGLFALPDMPLLFFTAMYCYCLQRFLERDDLKWAIYLAVVIALLLYSKYHGILLVFFTVLAIPRLLLNKKFYLIATISLLLFLPHLWWQYERDFVTLRYHFFDRPKSVFSFPRVFEFVGIQVLLAGVFIGPLVWWKVIAKKTAGRYERALKTIACGSFIFFLISTFSKKFEANWTIFLAIPLISLSVTSDLWKKKWAKFLLYGSFVLIFFSKAILLLSPELVPIKRLKEFHGWKKWAQALKEDCPDQVLMANTYQMASKLSFYLNEEVHSLNYRSRNNQFDFWRKDLRPMDRKTCFLSDLSHFGGEVIKTPEGKELFFSKHVEVKMLLDLKN